MFNLDYRTKFAIKVIILHAVALIGVPLWFIYQQPGIGEVFFFIFLAMFVSRIANVGYHRWLAHHQFEPTWIGRKLMLWCMVLSAESPPGHYVATHLQHHANTDKDGDPHGPKQIGLRRLFFGQYDTVTPKIGYLRFYSRQKDAQFVTEHYWLLYLINWIVLGLISKWLIIWMAFMFVFTWVWFIVINWNGHGGLKGEPTNLGWLSNIFMGGEDYHKNHHDKPGNLVYGKYDWTGKFIIPLLLK